jgi:hypothetical protein
VTAAAAGAGWWLWGLQNLVRICCPPFHLASLPPGCAQADQRQILKGPGMWVIKGIMLVGDPSLCLYF